MSIFDKLFGEEPTQERVDLFPEDAVQYEVQKSERYSKFLSETLSSYYDMPMEEADKVVSLNGEKALASRPADMVSVFDTLYSEKASSEKAQEIVNRYKQNMDLISVLDNPIVSEEVVKDPVLSTSDRLTRTISIIDQAAQKIAPKEGWFGFANSFAGTILYGMTGGVIENAAGTLDLDAGSWNRADDGRTKFETIYQEDDPVKAMALAESYMKEAADLGFLGGNSIRYWQQVETIKSGGFNENSALFTALDIAGIVPVSRIAKLLPLASDTVSTAAAVKGTTAANKAMSTALTNPSTVNNVAQHSAPSISRVGNTGLHPSLSPTLSNEVHNDYIDNLNNIFREQYITEEQVKEVAKNYVDTLSKRIKNHVSDYSVFKADDMDNRTIEVSLGKKDGSEFSDVASAKKFADTINQKLGIGVQPKEVITNGVSKGWVVSYQRNLPLKDFAKPIDPADLREYGIFNYLVSPELISAKDTLTLRKRGLLKIGAVEDQIFNKHISVMNKVSAKDSDTLTAIVQDIALKGYKSDWLNLTEFKDEYYRLTNRQASESAIEGYKSLYKLSDLYQTIEQDKVLKAKYREGKQSYRASFDGTKFYTVKALPKGVIATLKNAKVNPTKFVWDFDTNQLVKAEDFLKSKKTQVLFKFEDVDNAPVINGKAIVYGTGSVKKSMPVTPSDVFKKVPGGYKNSSNLDGFIIQKRLVEDLSGNTLNKLPRIIGAGRTQKEMEKIVDDLNNVIAVFKNNPTDDAAIEAVLKIKNGFDPSITTADDLREFIKNSGLDINQPLEIVTKADDLPDVGVGYLENYFNGKFKTYDDVYQRGIDNSVLYGYGNVNFSQLDPTRAITRDFAKAVNYMSTRASLVNSIEGLIKGAKVKNILLNEKDLLNKPLYAQVKEAMFKVGKEGDLFRAEQRTILQSLNEPSDVSLKWDATMNNLSNFIFDKTGKETYDILSKDPITALRSAAFHMKLGLFNPSQLILQSFQAMNIIAVSPILGFKAAAAYWPMRLALLNGSDDVIRATARKVGGLLDMTEDQFIQLATYYKNMSGLFSINQNIYENRSAMGLTRGMLGKIKEGSTFFFREGERISKGMATNVAYMEFLRKPGIKIKNGIVDLDDADTFRAFDSYMNKRVDDLTFNMTRASAAPWQDGLLGLATQWQSYTAKTIENLTFGRNFTPAEKARMAFAQVLLFGASGVPLGSWAVSALTDASEADIPKRTYTALQGGLLDTLLSSVVGEETSMSKRVAVGAALVDTIENVFNKNFIDVVGGPSTTIVWKTGDLGIKMLTSRFTGELDVANYDLVKLLREVSSFDAGTRAYMIWKTGEYINKRGETVASGLSPWQGMWNTLGVDYQQVTLQFDIREILKKEKDAVFKVANRVKELNKIMDGYIDNGDLNSANQINQDIQLLMSPLSWPERQDVLGLTRESLATTAEKLIREDYRRVGSSVGRQLEKIIKEE
jgi:hypothetical protein